MKKVILYLSFFMMAASIFAVDKKSTNSKSAFAANRKTATRYLKLAENYFLNGEYDNAIDQVNFALSYDETISDLYYIKAESMRKSGNYAVGAVLETSKTAKKYNDWIDYHEKANRVLLADLLSDTGYPFDSLEEIDNPSFIYSADAEAIRVKNYYRIGTEEYLEKARAKVSSSRRVYKNDNRFMELFYMFEVARALREGPEYEIPETVIELAEIISDEFFSRKQRDDEIEALSIFFMQGENQNRRMQEYIAHEKKSQLFALTALKSGFFTEEQAFNMFFEFADKHTPVEMLLYFSQLLKSEQIKNTFYEKLHSYEGYLVMDYDFDLQSEITVIYERGRPQYIHFDRDNDGEEELYAGLDFGAIHEILVKPYDTNFYFDKYPFVSKIVSQNEIFKNETGDGEIVAEFTDKSLQLDFVDFTLPPELQSPDGIPFYFPVVKENFEDQISYEMYKKSGFLKTGCAERENAKVLYTLLDGNFVSAEFSVNDKIYASCSFEDNCPFQRLLDSDNDGIFDLTETYGRNDNVNECFSDEDRAAINSLFRFFDFEKYIYLQQISIDRNEDTIPEYTENFQEKGGKSCYWDNDTDGNPESFYIRYPKEEGKPLVEDSGFVVGVLNDTVVVQSIDGEPVTVTRNQDVYKVVKGIAEHIYWLSDEKINEKESLIFNEMKEIEQGVISTFPIADKMVSCIKVADNIFVRVIEENYNLDEETLVEDVISDDVILEDVE